MGVYGFDRDPPFGGFALIKEMVAVASSPIEQFTIKPLAELQVAGIDVSFTNSSLMMVLVVGFLTGSNRAGVRGDEP